MTTGSVLMIEDDAGISAGLIRVLRDEGFTVTLERRGDDGLRQAEAGDFDVVLTDFKVPGLDGLKLVDQLHRSRPRLPIILMTAHGTTDLAIQATKNGAFDYLLKPFEMPELLQLLGKAVGAGRMMSDVVALGPGAAKTVREAIVGQSRVMQAIYKEIGRVAAKPVTVLIRGETGTGKELIARAIYQHSDRAQQPFIAVNCSAIPETLLESELFGHEKGAFTGADVRRIGRFEQADGGTIFLDEIGEMTPGTQAKLLRVLQEKTIQRVGGKDTIQIDVRVLAATHRNLEEALADKSFREDLYYRLNVAVVNLPPLRERREDIPELVNYFLQKHGRDLGVGEARMQPEAMSLMQAYHWPGNIRELENTVRKSLLGGRGFVIGTDVVRDALTAGGPGFTAPWQSGWKETIGEALAKARRGEMEGAHGVLIEALERELFAQAIELSGGNQAKAARWLGVSRLTMREKLKQFGLRMGAE